jgi:hypothetical protein
MVAFVMPIVMGICVGSAGRGAMVTVPKPSDSRADYPIVGQIGFAGRKVLNTHSPLEVVELRVAFQGDVDSLVVVGCCHVCR